jgi:hypothetical protein
MSCNEGRAAFICENEGSDRRIPDAESDHCPQCRPDFSWDRKNTHKLLEHIGAHLLFDNSLDTSLELCGLCFRPSPLCVFYLRKGKAVGASQQIDMQRSRCPNLLKTISYQSAATESTNSPCTNVPVICHLCSSTSSAVWKYNMKAHFENSHPTLKYKDYLAPFMLSESEQMGLSTVWNKRYMKRRKNKAAKPKNLLTISEAHSTRQVFS